MDPASLFVGALFTSAATYAYTRWTTPSAPSNSDPVLPPNSNQTPASNATPVHELSNIPEVMKVPRSGNFLNDVLTARANLRPSVNSTETPVLPTADRLDPAVLLLNINRARLSLKSKTAKPTENPASEALPSEIPSTETPAKTKEEPKGFETVYRLIVARRDQFETDLANSALGNSGFGSPYASVIVPPPSLLLSERFQGPREGQEEHEEQEDYSLKEEIRSLDQKLEDHLESERKLKQEFFAKDLDEMIQWLESNYIHCPSPQEAVVEEEVSPQLSQIYSSDEYYFQVVAFNTPVNPLSLSSLKEDESDCEDLDVSDESMPVFDEPRDKHKDEADLEQLLRELSETRPTYKSYPITEQMKNELDQLLEEISAMKPKEASMIFDPIPIAPLSTVPEGERDSLANLELHPEAKQEGSLWELMRDIN